MEENPAQEQETKPVTEEEKLEPRKDDSQQRIDNFMREYGELVAKYEVDFLQYPQWTPVGNGTSEWKMVMQTRPIDIRTLAKPSPFVAQS